MDVSAAARDAYPGLQEATFNPRNAVTWIEEKPAASQVSYANDIFEELLQSAARPRQSSGQACVKLCGFIEQCSRSKSPDVQDYAFSEKTANDLFNYYVEWNEQDQHRSMRLVLDFLKSSITRNQRPENGEVIKTRLLNDIVSFITLKSIKPSVKSAFMALDYFIQKRIFYLPGVIQTYQKIHGVSEDQRESWNTFVARIFDWMIMKHLSPVAGKLLATIFSTTWSEQQDARFLPDSWHKFLSAGLAKDIELLEPIQIYIMMPLYTSDKVQMLKYLELLFSLQTLTKDQSDLDVTSMLWLASLEAGKKVGIVGEPLSDREETSKTQGIAHLQKDVLEDILSHSSQEARSSAVSILIASPSSTKPYSIASLELLRKHLPAFYSDGDAKFRYDVLGYSRNMISRVQGAISGLAKELERLAKKAKKNNTGGTNAEDPDKLKHLLQLHDDFLGWYFNFLKNELVPTASYQRHITSLRAMEFVLKSESRGKQNGSKEAWLGSQLVDSAWLRSVLDLIMDPFDDVRETATNLLVLLSTRYSENSTTITRPMLQELEEFCTRASELASKTSRADHSDGVARSYEVLCQWTRSKDGKVAIAARILADIELRLSAAESDLASAVLDAPIHGGFAALRYVWQSLSSTDYSSDEVILLETLQARAISSCQRIWQAVRLVLCDDSPEGHLPEELEEVDQLDTKDLLSYSFRAIHESSHLLRVISSNIRIKKSGYIRPSSQEFEAIGNLTFEQLSNLRHRGAFTTVTQTFASCCQLVKYSSSSSEQDKSLLKVWYQGALDCIHTQASTTRRSAGIPALIVGILASNSDEPSFDTVMHELRDIAQRPAHVSETDGSNLPQVHATNCIKDIFKSSMLSRRAEPYLTDCLQLAANSLRSEVWAIRNCGLILLRSLIDCLFGTSESKVLMEAGWDGRSTRVAWHKYKSLPMLLVSLLKSGQATTSVSKEIATAESVFPALDIIRRAGPPEEFKDELYGIVAWYLGSHIWHVREIAARTLCSFLLHADWFGHVKTLLAESQSSANKLHGALLTFKFLLERLLDTMQDQLLKHYPEDLSDLVQSIPSMPGSFTTCAEVRAVYFEIISFLNGLASNSHIGAQLTDPVLLELNDASSQSSANSFKIRSALEEAKEAQASTASEMERIMRSPDQLANFDIGALLKSDVNAACDALETMLSYVEVGIGSLFVPLAASRIIKICITAVYETHVPKPRALALNILAAELDGLVHKDAMAALPATTELTSLWQALHSGALNPGLADAIIRVSGPLVRFIIMRGSAEASAENNEQWLKSWGTMMRSAGSVDNGFDTRMSGIQAIRSFTATSSNDNNTLSLASSANLPWLLALYDYLNDDDEEIRDAAATAAAPVLGKPLVSIEAGERLLTLLADLYRDDEEFRHHAASRLVGEQQQQLGAGQEWTPAEIQLAQALRFDDSLFVVEEQNLYIDEVREAMRWRDALFHSSSSSSSSSPSGGSRQALADWTTASLGTLSRIAAERGDDGVLGWTSKPEVFAICARIAVAGAALSDSHEAVRDELRAFVGLGQKTRVHGLLLQMCGI
ncbi:hypothetical protein PFICI_03774 [Pestalotiopsis fici W106-1]|uniref:Uncharacterized protein n=1 Tax=Pestalotiopsis fici (strain W106-1 / CGMCC3.15140) TaxID=1229662 RepID=W3XID5_PESFW|nr:uncharacterized protein PFICI_03774 [Pestalotiopsis fici W106-1]ETS85749.1 hypothetical protein PFICI_03774 [Pestalotiopsis fici W106-1]